MASLQVVEDMGLAAFDARISVTQPLTAMLTLARIEQDTELLQVLRSILLEGMGRYAQDLLTPFHPAADRNGYVLNILRTAIAQAKENNGIIASIPDDEHTLLGIFAATLGWGPAQQYIDDPRVQEIKINGTQLLIQEEGKPFIEAPVRFLHVQDVIDRVLVLADVLQVQLHEHTPQATLPVTHGTRMHVTIPPRCARDHVLVVIRRGRSEGWSLHDVLAKATLSEETLQLLTLCCRVGANILVAGECGTGKTAILEACANTVPTGKHILTVEDHTLELGLKHDHIWTRETVDTHSDPLAYGKVVTEALRQRPDYVIPGEVRGNEAGAILALLRSGHAVMTTIHAASCTDAIERFADCATLQGAFMYDGRKDHALRDTAVAFDVVVHMELWDALGKRIVSAVELVSLATGEQRSHQIVMQPLVHTSISDDGVVTWHTFAHVDRHQLIWHDAAWQTPATLQRKMEKHRFEQRVSQSMPSVDVLQHTMQRIRGVLAAGDAQKALSQLVLAWGSSQDMQLLTLAQQALSYDAPRYQAIRTAAQQQLQQLCHSMDQRLWQESAVLYQAMLQSIDVAALGAPVGGWNPTAQRIRTGMQCDLQAVRITKEVSIALNQMQSMHALGLLDSIDIASMCKATTCHIARLREQALAQLLEAGAVSKQVWQTAYQDWQAQERALGFGVLQTREVGL